MKKRVMAGFSIFETRSPPSRGRLLQTSLFIKALVVGILAFVTAAAFSAYLKPGMLIEFANLVLCM